MMRAVCYTRVSTREQAESGFSLAAQEESARAYATAQSWELAEVYSDAGKSGGSREGRDELARLLVDAARGQFQRVIVWKLDRFARNLRDLLNLSDELDQYNVGIVSIQESIDTGTATGRLMRSVLGTLAEFEREVITERIIAGLAQKAREGELLGHLPLGYLRSGTGAVVADEVTAPLVRAAFERYKAGGVSLRELAKWAGTVGLRSSGGNALDRLSIRKILMCVTYTGQVAYRGGGGGDAILKGKHLAIVDADTFAQVQEMLRSRRRHSGVGKPFGRVPYPLSRIAVCGVDGARLVGARAGKNRRRYMRCSTAERHGKGACAQPMVRAEVLEAQMAAYVGGMRLPPEYLGAVVAELRQRQRPTPDPSKGNRIERQLERWRRLFVMEEIDEERYRRETRPLKQQLAELEEPPAEVLDVERALVYLRDAGALWAGSSRQQQSDFVREVFERIEVTGAQVSAITPRASYAPLFVIDRRERFNGEGGVVQLPGQVTEHPPVAWA